MITAVNAYHFGSSNGAYLFARAGSSVAPAGTGHANQHLLVIAAPSITDAGDDPFFAEIFQDVVDFDIAYANAVYGHDQIRIVVDEETRPYFTGRVPQEILIEANIPHIWMRDYTTINPYDPIQFRYTAASFEGDQAEAEFMQDGFNRFAAGFGFTFPKSEHLLDGGNIVDNYAGRIVTTERFLEDNALSREEGKAILKQLLDADEVAILPPDEDVLAHSDGMVMFAEADTIIVNQYPEPLRTIVLDELKSAFPGIKIVEIETTVDWDDPTTSSCGINVNATVTANYIYMPQFGDAVSDRALKTIAAHTSKTVIPVPANKVCDLGGSVRCLTWQMGSDAARRFMNYQTRQFPPLSDRYRGG
jgi:agmatine/peptidylarginine deiminase